MEKRWLACLAAVSLALMGCAGSECDDLADADDAAVDKAEDCRGLIDADYFVKSTERERTVCKDGIDECSEDDKQTISDMADCLNGLAACSASNPEVFTDGWDACVYGNFVKLSPTCVAAISEESSLRLPAHVNQSR
jgi:hypothetical protein